MLVEKVQALAREIAGLHANARIHVLAHRVAEAQIGLRRVRHLRHQFLSSKDSARKLARDCARDQADAVDKVDGILARTGTNIEYLLKKAQNKKAEELGQAYLRGEEDAINLVNKHLENAAVTIDDLVVKSMHGRELEYIERIDRLTTIGREARHTLRNFLLRGPTGGRRGYSG